jgi:hypothetical protein
MSESSSRIPIVVALITAVASVGVAFIANWDKLLARPAASSGVSPVPVATPAPTASPAPAPAPAPVTVTESPSPALAPARARDQEPAERPAAFTQAPRPPTVAGTWRDVTYPGIVSSISQEGPQFRFARSGMLPNGVAFQSSGAGTLSGDHVALQYLARYNNGQVSQGGCEGALSEAGDEIELLCSDSLLGGFQSVSVRQ